MQIQATIYGPGYDAANQTAYLDQMLRWGLDWAMRVSQAERERASFVEIQRY